jgi:hypothetical protein
VTPAQAKFPKRTAVATTPSRLARRELRTYGTAFPPELFRNRQRIDIVLLPPATFVASRMVFGVVDSAKRYREFIAYFQRNASRLPKANMMRLRWRATAD